MEVGSVYPAKLLGNPIRIVPFMGSKYSLISRCASSITFIALVPYALETSDQSSQFDVSPLADE
ncbi:hypothetical protein F4694_002905 [Bacillus niacini]|uniref:Uncharacterized protein n=1 Tax=Neobacillus niacini TaxID=86668 RepID=A0A852TBG9_9BACI|nr:hypothetical protein [Neobacillus niacini]